MVDRGEDIRAAAYVRCRLLEEVRDLSARDPDSGNILIQADTLESIDIWIQHE